MNRFGVRALVCLLFLSLSTIGTAQSDCANLIASGDRSTPTYGWEVEYVRGENPGLWQWYRPEMISDENWRAQHLAARDLWTRENAARLAPTTRVPAALVRMPEAPAFLPERLIMDESGNWEIIGGVSSSLEQLEGEIKTVEAAVGPGSYQAHVVLPFSTFEKGSAGYSLFSADLLALRKLTTQLARHRKDPKQVPGAFFIHPFLSVFTKLKRDMLVAIAEANADGRGWESALPLMRSLYPELNHVWDENRPYYKYTLANALRTDIYGNEGDHLLRWGFEVRSAHKSLPMLFEEAHTLRSLMKVGFSNFDRFLDLKVLDPSNFTRVFSIPVQKMLNAVVPEGEVEDPRPRYFAYIYRPFEQYAVLLGLPPGQAKELRLSILRARTHAVAALETLAAQFQNGAIDAKKAREGAMITLAQFSEEMNLLPSLETFLSQALEGQTAERSRTARR